MDFSTRPATLDDAPAIHQLIAAAEQLWHGETERAPDQVAADLQRPLITLDLDTRVVEANGEIVAWAWVHGGRRAQVDVRPSYVGLGLGTQLLDWAEARAREHGSDWLAQTVDDADEAGTALLRARGYDVLATNWLLERPVSGAAPTLPDGVTLRPCAPGDERAVHQVLQDAFDEWQPRRHEYDEWAGMTIERSSFDPELSPVAVAGDEIVGAAISLDLADSPDGYVDQVAVRRDFRGRGLARALLTYAALGAGRRGKETLTLWTHSGTGALAMYQRLGMSVRRSTTVYRTAL
ncbi:GNAT family N-acetyltransferase [Kribbella speibonae]|uniref:GNAT family N-acetyltransferase n=1 Tax=Kribbella speibonae TaxID=1572660 RepID=A0A4R0J0T3_9ACTN|nr:GNAT family N-acetyltransferase [Kribbella speibonae]TCC25564.1 GNAT family N-acetyltransferase [Kribbella speibonae]TCC37686.1 GNAT family N-acetyltransferase [Kribbella speibonae]